MCGLSSGSWLTTRGIAVAVSLTVALSAHAGERKVLTIGIDGLRPDALAAANAPNIDSLLDGSFFGTSGPSGIFATYAQVGASYV